MFDLFSRLYEERIDCDRRVGEILDEAKTKVASYFRIPKYLLNFKYRIGRLPEIYETGIKRIGNYFVKYTRSIGKVLGMFDPYTDVIDIDQSNLENYYRLRKVILHEVVHGAQKVLGKIYRLPRYLLEREAHSVAEALA